MRKKTSGFSYHRHQLRCRMVEIGSYFSLRLFREIALTVGALLGVLGLVGAIAAVGFGIRPIVFESGSMSPAIDTGALAISRTVPASDLAVGDVVTVKAANGVHVTHRITSMEQAGDAATLVLRGDANGAPDSEAYSVTSAPRVLFDVPRAGYVVSYLSGPVGVFGGGVLVGLVVLTLVRPTRRGGGRAHGPRRHVPVAAGLVLAVGVGAALTGVRTTSTEAYYSDSASATSGTFTAASDSEPGHLCSLDGTILTFHWAPVLGATGYDLSVRLKGGAATVLHVEPGALARLDLRDLSAGVHVVSLTAIGAESGVSVSTSLGTVVVIKVGNLLTLGSALCLNLDIHLDLKLPGQPEAALQSTTAEPSAEPTGQAEPPSDEPGTEEPSTDEPGTEEPGAEPTESPEETPSADEQSPDGGSTPAL